MDRTTFESQKTFAREKESLQPKKNRLTPMTEIKAPTIAFQVIFSWKSQYEHQREANTHEGTEDGGGCSNGKSFPVVHSLA